MRCERPALRVVVDTNVWVSAVLLPDSVPGRVVQAVRDARLTAVTSWELAGELADALRRPKLARYGVTETDLESLLLLMAPELPEVDVDLDLRDPDDVHVVAAALGGGAEAIVTGDRDLLEDTALVDWLAERGITVETPASLVSRLGLP